MIIFPATRRLRALVVKQHAAADWVVVLRTYPTSDAPQAKPDRSTEPTTFHAALAKARLWFGRHGLPVTIQPLDGEERDMTTSERRLFDGAYASQQRPSLDDILNGRAR